MSASSTNRLARGATLVLLAIGALGLLAACGDDGPELSPQAAEGRDLIRDRGCAACHGRNGGGGVGPSWVGLHGTMEELESGEEVLVDADYLRRSIVDPSADRVAGYSVTMPDNTLDDDEIDAVIAYIEALG
jgi:cytochrome c oxidase subunit 2